MNKIDGVISIKDLFAELVRRCWLIIICVLLFASLLGGYKLIGNLQATKNSEEEINALTEEEMEASHDYVAKYKQYESIKEYYKNSLLFQIDPYNVYRTELQFLITGDVKEDDLPTIRAAYADYALFGRLASDIEAAYGDYEELAIKELIETDSLIREQDPTLKTVRIMIFAKDEEQTAEMVACVKEQFAEYSKEINQTIAPHEFVLIDENTFHYVKGDLIGKRDDYKNRMDTLEEEVEMLEGQLSSVQMNYALQLIGEEEEVDETEKENKQGIGIKSILKFAIVGGVLGGAFSVVLIVALYFFTNEIKNEKETELVYEIPHLGNCCIYENKGFEKLADNLFYKNKTKDVDSATNAIIENLTDICKEKNVLELCFVGALDEKAKLIMNQICEMLQKKNIKTSVLETVLMDERKETLPQNIVHVEIIRKTSGEEIKREVNFCAEHELTLHGYITFSK